MTVRNTLAYRKIPMVKSFVAALSPGMQPNENRKRKRFRANAKKLFTAVNNTDM